MSTFLAAPALTRPATPVAPVQLLVDLAAVAHNTRLLRSRSADHLMAVVKADGFGHGAEAVARTALASGATALGVTSLAEAFALREAGITAPLLSWLNPVEADFEEAARRDVQVAVPGPAHLAAVCASAERTGRPAQVHLHVDVGMARDGCPPELWRRLCLQAREAERRGQVRVVGVMGHLGCADRPREHCNRIWTGAFAAAARTALRSGLTPRIRHLAATAATLTNPSARFDGSRVGAGLVGIDPSGSTELRPAMTVTARVVDVREVRAGTRVGYGHAHTTTGRTRLALLPLGYADGVPRAAGGHASVLLRGRRRPLVGAVSMDQVVVDTGDDVVRPGELATVLGPGDDGEPTVADWAGWSGTIAHEIVTGLGRRVPRVPRVSAPVGRS